MLKEDVEADRIIFLAALEGQILLEQFDIIHIAYNLALLKHLKKLLVTDLLRTSGQSRRFLV